MCCSPRWGWCWPIVLFLWAMYYQPWLSVDRWWGALHVSTPLRVGAPAQTHHTLFFSTQLSVHTLAHIAISPLSPESACVCVRGCPSMSEQPSTRVNMYRKQNQSEIVRVKVTLCNNDGHSDVKQFRYDEKIAFCIHVSDSV
jgi:hypothetical protein